ncbi:MAG: SIS domain-containing protein [Actinophytocola sp.]|nr:SIS domain-containing protein [Actinophytocola sp.]
MSGILAVVPAPVPPRAPDLPGVARTLEQLRLPAPIAVNCHEGTLRRTESALRTVNTLLATPDAEQRLLAGHQLLLRLRAAGNRLERAACDADAALDRIAGAVPPARLEATQQFIRGITDALWTFRHDRLGRIDRLGTYLETAGAAPAIAPISAVTGYRAIEIALRGIDRLEASGREAAGLYVWVGGSGVPRVFGSAAEEIAARAAPMLTNGAVTVSAGGLGFSYTTAAPAAGPGDNVRALRETVRQDHLLARALHAVGARVSVLAHTRDAGACPVESTVAGSASCQHTVAVLDGRVERGAERIPVLFARNAHARRGLHTTGVDTLAALSGSFAFAAHSERDPDAVVLAVRGAAPRLYVGLSPAAWVVASHPAGLAGESSNYLTVAATPGPETDATGRILVLRRDGAGEIAGLTRYDLAGDPLPVTDGELEQSDTGVRSADRGPFPHVLLNELAQSPDTVAKTLRGRIVAEPGGARRVRLGDKAMPERVADAVRSGRIRRLLIVGDGAAAVAGAGIATAAGAMLGSRLRVSAVPATTLAKLRADADLRDCLLVAVSHTGASAATNRAVDRVRSLGATVLAIVNHRSSALANRSHGVLFVSDGRDDEIPVVATKSLCSQAAAGLLLTAELQRLLRISSKDADAAALLASLRRLPEQIAKLVNSRESYLAAAAAATRARHWAVLAAGPATDIRRRLAVLCQRPILTTTTHIESSSTGMLLVCAAGVDDAVAERFEADARTFSARGYLPVVIATEGDARFQDIDNLLEVPETHPSVAWLLTVLAGQLFAYECAVATGGAKPLVTPSLAGGRTR